MTSTVGGRVVRSWLGRRSWQLLVLVVLLSCGVVAMHGLGEGRSLGSVHGPTLAAGVSHEGLAAADETRPGRAAGGHAVVVFTAVGKLTADHQIVDGAASGCPQCAGGAAPLGEQTGGHDGMAMCLAVLYLLVWVVLSQCRISRIVSRCGGAGRRAFLGLVRGPPSRRAPSLSELCICRT